MSRFVPKALDVIVRLNHLRYTETPQVTKAQFDFAAMAAGEALTFIEAAEAYGKGSSRDHAVDRAVDCRNIVAVTCSLDADALSRKVLEQLFYANKPGSEDQLLYQQ